MSVLASQAPGHYQASRFGQLPPGCTHPEQTWRCAWQEYKGQPGCVLAGESRRQELVTNVDKGWWNARAWDVYIAGTQARKR